MLLGILFAAVNLTCLIVLLSRRYYRLFPCFMAAQALTAWQAGVRLFGESRAWWTPGEVLLILATVAAMGEAVLASLHAMRFRWKALSIVGYALIAGGLTHWACAPLHGDWFRMFTHEGRVALFFFLGVFALLGLGSGWTENWHSPIVTWPRASRMHLGLYTVLIAGHAYAINWDTWGNANVHYRWLEMVCCAGWMINNSFRAKELVSCDKAQCAALARLGGNHPASVEDRPRRAAFLGRPLEGD